MKKMHPIAEFSKADLDELWEQKWRPYEVYMCNSEPVEYFGQQKEPGEVTGWDIEHVFARREDLKDVQFFDAVITGSCMVVCDFVIL
jgi:hypothetical protein